MRELYAQNAAQPPTAAASHGRVAIVAATSTLNASAAAAHAAPVIADTKATDTAVARAVDSGLAEPKADHEAQSGMPDNSVANEAAPSEVDYMVGSLFSCPITKVSRLCRVWSC